MVSCCNPHFRVTASAGNVKQRRNEIYGELSKYKYINNLSPSSAAIGGRKHRVKLNTSIPALLTG